MPATDRYTRGGLHYTLERSRGRVPGRRWWSLLLFVLLMIGVGVGIAIVVRSTDVVAQPLPKLEDERTALEQGMPRNPIGSSRFLAIDDTARWFFQSTGSCATDPLAPARATVLRRFVSAPGVTSDALVVVAASFSSEQRATTAFDALRRFQVTCVPEALPGTPLPQLDSGPEDADQAVVVSSRPGGSGESIVAIARTGRWVVWASSATPKEARSAVGRLLDTVTTIDAELRSA